MNLQYDAEFNIYAKKSKNLLDMNKCFLHREIFTKFYDDQFNENTVMDYKSVLDQSFLFTINHFAHLALIRTTQDTLGELIVYEKNMANTDGKLHKSKTMRNKVSR